MGMPAGVGLTLGFCALAPRNSQPPPICRPSFLTLLGAQPAMASSARDSLISLHVSDSAAHPLAYFAP